jgi:hypothetical protein
VKKVRFIFHGGDRSKKAAAADIQTWLILCSELTTNCHCWLRIFS